MQCTVYMCICRFPEGFTHLAGLRLSGKVILMPYLLSCYMCTLNVVAATSVLELLAELAVLHYMYNITSMYSHSRQHKAHHSIVIHSL